jgi:hypothetical protein
MTIESQLDKIIDLLEQFVDSNSINEQKSTANEKTESKSAQKMPEKVVSGASGASKSAKGRSDSPEPKNGSKRDGAKVVANQKLRSEMEALVKKVRDVIDIDTAKDLIQNVGEAGKLSEIEDDKVEEVIKFAKAALAEQEEDDDEEDI